MTGYDQWLAANDQFLSELVAWLRGRLEQLAGDHQPAGRPGPATNRDNPPRRRRQRDGAGGQPSRSRGFRRPRPRRPDLGWSRPC